MADIYEQKWIYLGKKRKHFIRLEHNQETGEIFIFLNGSKFLEQHFTGENQVIDFFIDDELCSINIGEKEDGIYYGFQSQRRSSSKSSKTRREIRGNAKRKAIAIVIGLFLLVVGLPLYFLFYSQWQKKMELKKHGMESLAMISLPQKGTGNFMYNTYFIYPVGDSLVQGTDDIFVNDRGQRMAPNGMPLNHGDEFIVIYSSKNPENSKLDFERLTDKQLSLYKTLALEKLCESLGWSMQDENQLNKAICLVEGLYQQDGLEALGDMIFSSEKKVVNRNNNKKTFQDRLEEEATQSVLSKCGIPKHQANP